MARGATDVTGYASENFHPQIRHVMCAFCEYSFAYWHGFDDYTCTVSTNVGVPACRHGDEAHLDVQLA